MARSYDLQHIQEQLGRDNVSRTSFFGRNRQMECTYLAIGTLLGIGNSCFSLKYSLEFHAGDSDVTILPRPGFTLSLNASLEAEALHG